MDLELTNKGVFVVGASGDIGRATVNRFLDEGARVFVAGRTASRLRAAFEGRMAGSTTIDLRDDLSINNAVEEARKALGVIDVLVCTAAGDNPFGTVWDADRKKFEDDYAVKCIGNAQLCRHVAKQMVAHGSGAIVIVIGINTDMLVLTNPVGSSTNSGLRAFTRVLAGELAPSGVRVVGVSPGMTMGDRLGRFAGDALEQIRQSIPLRRIGQPQEMADVIAFLASPRAGYMAGTIVTVDGGLTLVR
jgi:NAD(P)-dependent dehydrogenase (short-subunit alcohol dehydrogenase family)